jgi:nanoRNase/pAp phosphatase (c-di-AMP/oligoRNAs hydrolase)
MKAAASNRNDRIGMLKNILTGKEKVLIMVHDNPDPDALASAIGFKYLLQSVWKISSLISYGGIIGRAENRVMIKLLDIDIVPFPKVQLKKFTTVALIDTQPGSGNNSLPPAYIPDIVIDHHMPIYEKSRRAAFSDIRTDYGSTSTIITEYLGSAGILGGNRKIATALLYGIKSDTRNLGRETGATDVAAYLELFPHVLLKVLSRIEHPKLSRRYFGVISRAVDRALVYEDAVITDLGRVESADSLAEMADFLIRAENTRWTLCLGEFENSLYFSLRTTISKANAGLLARRLARRNGSGGGHCMIAGGRIPVNGNYQEQAGLLKSKFLKEINKQDVKGEPLAEPSAAPVRDS